MSVPTYRNNPTAALAADSVSLPGQSVVGTAIPSRKRARVFCSARPRAVARQRARCCSRHHALRVAAQQVVRSIILSIATRRSDTCHFRYIHSRRSRVRSVSTLCDVRLFVLLSLNSALVCVVTCVQNCYGACSSSWLDALGVFALMSTEPRGARNYVAHYHMLVYRTVATIRIGPQGPRAILLKYT